MKEEIIEKTRDYNKFKFLDFNRPINHGLVKRIILSIQEIGYIKSKSVLVDKDFNILDGQHRFTACEQLGIDIYYSITRGDSHKIVTNLNSEQVNWKMGDFVHSWAENGVSCYVKLEDFENKYQLGISNSINILFGKSSDRADIKNIKAGKHFSINPKAEKLMDFLLYCKELVPYWKSSYFIKATTRFFEMANESQIDKVKKYIISLPQQATAANYIVAFENLVNKGVTAKKRVSFKSSVTV